MKLDAENLSDQFLVDNSEMDGKFMVFWMDDQLYALPVRNVVQIIKSLEITEVPEYPNYAKGIINFRGSIIPVISIRLRFGKLEIPWNQKTCVIVASVKDRNVGIIVDEVDEVVHIDEKDITNIPGMSEKKNSRYLTGIAKHHDIAILLLDAELLFCDDQLRVLSNS